MDLIESGKVKTLIVKDMSRLGREYLFVLLIVKRGRMHTTAGAAKFIEMAKKYTEITELTSEILWTFIERIEVCEREEKHRHYTPQEVRIYYRDIGLLDEIPANPIKKYR